MSDSCTVWAKARSSKGYGKVKVGGRVLLAHRVAYCRANGLTIEEIDGQVVRHTCDNPPCVNPDHLELGTQVDNVKDMMDRGRAARGAKMNTAKLTEQDVLAIRSEYVPRSRELGSTGLAHRYGVSPSLINRIINRRVWSHV